MRRPSKYRAIKTEVDGIKFDSRKEAAKYCELKTLLKLGVISDLELQPSYDLKINGQLICRYRADFRYIENGKTVVMDVKGYKTDVYKLKRKMMKACHDIDIIEV